MHHQLGSSTNVARLEGLDLALLGSSAGMGDASGLVAEVLDELRANVGEELLALVVDADALAGRALKEASGGGSGEHVVVGAHVGGQVGRNTDAGKLGRDDVGEVLAGEGLALGSAEELTAVAGELGKELLGKGLGGNGGALRDAVHTRRALEKRVALGEGKITFGLGHLLTKNSLLYIANKNFSFKNNEKREFWLKSSKNLFTVVLFIFLHFPRSLAREFPFPPLLVELEFRPVDFP